MLLEPNIVLEWKKLLFSLKGVAFLFRRYYFSMLNDFQFQSYELCAFSNASKHTYATVLYLSNGSRSHHLPPCPAFYCQVREFVSFAPIIFCPAHCHLWGLSVSYHFLSSPSISYGVLFLASFFWSPSSKFVLRTWFSPFSRSRCPYHRSRACWAFSSIQLTFSDAQISSFFCLSSSVISLIRPRIFVSVVANILFV